MNRPRLLLIYHRNPTTTAAYLEDALRRTADVVTAGEGQDLAVARDEAVFLPRLLERAGGHFDLVLEVEGENVPTHGHEQLEVPCAWWAIDSHLHMSYDHHFFRAKRFDHVFVAQKHHVVRYRDWAWTESSWLPLAADPEVFHPIEGADRFVEIGFVGNVLPRLHEARRSLLRRIYEAFDRVLLVRGAWRERVSEELARCRLVFNRSLHRDVNMRVFEALACGRPLLTDRLDAECGLQELFTDGEHVILYDDATLEETARRWLADPEAAEGIGAAGREHVFAHHTYDHRARTILETMGLLGEPRPAAEQTHCIAETNGSGGAN